MGRLVIDVIDAEPVPGMEVSSQGDALPGRVHSVVVTGRWTRTRPAGSGREPATGHTLLTFGRRGAGWEILRDASM
jgi:hypothetical protein